MIFFIVEIEPLTPVSQNGHDLSASPKLNKKSTAPPPPPPKPPRPLSSKVRQAPNINEIHCLNGTNNNQASAIHS